MDFSENLIEVKCPLSELYQGVFDINSMLLVMLTLRAWLRCGLPDFSAIVTGFTFS